SRSCGEIAARCRRDVLPSQGISTGVSHRLKTRGLQTKRFAPSGQCLAAPAESGAKLFWGVSPEGFARFVDRDGNRLVVRQDQMEYIDFSLCHRGSLDEPRATR